MYEINSYPIISIEKKYCLQTQIKYLDKLRTCVECGKIPLPSYKSFSKQNNTYCKNCYDKQNFDPNSFIENTSEELLLKKLVINCKNKDEGCLRNYNIKTLQDLIDHEKGCSLRKSVKENTIYIDEAQDNCFRTYDLNVNVANHDCMSNF